ncbi:hypothetical protein [Nonomuraea longicatena]|uniref:Uncharacterized protein n=1 Tax=Nonomuraea longicatena TaxID=83682 RepID=A0ABN1NWX1_9ACTN
MRAMIGGEDGTALSARDAAQADESPGARGRLRPGRAGLRPAAGADRFRRVAGSVSR